MSLDLDPRQRAMLAEMGVRVWLPAADVDAAPLPPVAHKPAATAMPASTPPAQQAPVRLPDPTPHLPPDAASTPVASPTQTRTNNGHLDAVALRDAVAACQACAQGRGRKAAVLPGVSPGQRTDWMVLGDSPDDAQERAGEAFVGDAGVLLDNMLKAVGVRRSQPGVAADPAISAHLALTLKCRPALPAAPQRDALDTCAHHLRQEIALVQPKVILSMGRLAMLVLLSEDHPEGLKLPLGKLRGQVWHYQGVPVVVTYPPSYLLLNPQDKARAWEDLCLAADVAQGKLPAH